MRDETRVRDTLGRRIILLLLILILFSPKHATSQGDKGVEEWIRDLQDKNPVVRWTAAEELGRTRDGRAVEPLIAALQDRDEGVRREVVRALGQIGDPRATQPLGEMLDDNNDLVRTSALWALERIRDDHAVGLIISALKNTNPLVRMNASTSLGRIGEQKALGPLEEVAATDQVSYVRVAAQQARLQIRRKVLQEIADRARKSVEEASPRERSPSSPRERRPASDKKTQELIAQTKKVAERVQMSYGLVLDNSKYDIMELLDIEARMKMRRPRDTIEGVLGDLLTEQDKERNRHLFE